MNKIETAIIQAVAEGRVTRNTVLLAQRLMEQRARAEAAAAARSCTTAQVAKQAIASVAHHEKARRAEAREEERVSNETMKTVRERSARAHMGLACCEACHKSPLSVGPLEPHHLEMGSGNRRDAPEVVMLLCAGCHRMDPLSAHRAPRRFAQQVVILWLDLYNYPTPNRKEYR